jgi:aldehyde:ferredoxin oxidoreductase
MCRFTTKLFNSPSLPGLEEFSAQIANVTGFELTPEQLDRIGLNVMGVERMINYRLGVRRKDDTLPDRWFDEPNQYGHTRVNTSTARSSTHSSRASIASRISPTKAFRSTPGAGSSRRQ